MRFATLSLLTLLPLTLANNAVFSGYGPNCQACLDTVVNKCNDGTSDSVVLLCFCGDSEFVRDVRTCGTGVCATEDATSAANIPTVLTQQCCGTVYWKGMTQCMAISGSPLASSAARSTTPLASSTPKPSSTTASTATSNGGAVAGASSAASSANTASTHSTTTSAIGTSTTATSTTHTSTAPTTAAVSTAAAGNAGIYKGWKVQDACAVLGFFFAGFGRFILTF